MSRCRPSFSSPLSGADREGAGRDGTDREGADGATADREGAMGEFCLPMTTPLGLRDFDFALPPELIAQHPAAERSGSRLLDGRGEVAADRMFRDLPGLLRAG